ncbi:MAG TPA: hypothetical protein VJ349_25650, partial [Stellaceae bacterium]|nr:hypothetical protein [Stellaceae bacterium]
QEMTKDLECQVVVSEEVYKVAGLPEDGPPVLEIVIRGHATPMVVRTVAEAEHLGTMMATATSLVAEIQDRHDPGGKQRSSPCAIASVKRFTSGCSSLSAFHPIVLQNSG